MKIASCGSPTDCHWHWLSSDWDCRVSFFTGETQRHCRQRRSLCHLWWRCQCLSLVNRGTHLRLHGTYQTAVAVFISNNAQQQWTVLNLKQHCHTANNCPWSLDEWSAPTQCQWQPLSVTLLVSWSTMVLGTYRSHLSLATGTNLRTRTRLGP